MITQCASFMFFIPLPRGGRTLPLSFECKIYQADFTARLSFLPSNLMEEIIPNLKALSSNT